jgi:hypothetical protein
MGIISRIGDVLYQDPLAVQTFEAERREYHITHLNGNVTTVQGHYHTRDEGFLLIGEYDSDTCVKYIVPYCIEEDVKEWNNHSNIVSVLEDVESVEYDVLGTDVWNVTVDFRKREIVGVERESIE